MHKSSDTSSFLLTYCTNIHPGNGWDEVFAQLQQYVPALKQRFAPQQPFGIGLRLSGHESVELLQDNHLADFQAYLRAQGLFVFTLNGFPYGPFHRQPVKTFVHAPDWREEERVAYTLRLIDILAALLPEGMQGSISTSPLSYKEWVDNHDESLWRLFTGNLVRVAEHLIRIRQERGIFISLALEPEPDGLLENADEVVRFYTDWLLVDGAKMLASTLSLSLEEAQQHLLDHIRICFDTCHVAIEYESPESVLDKFAQVGIKIGKVQISSALKVVFPEDKQKCLEIIRALEPFAESTYLHQVIELKRNGHYQHYADLSEALSPFQGDECIEWRIHFHVPISIEQFPLFQSTQQVILETLALLKQRRFCEHVEIETYTWDVLPAELKTDLFTSLTREYTWLLEHIG